MTLYLSQTYVMESVFNLAGYAKGITILAFDFCVISLESSIYGVYNDL